MKYDALIIGGGTAGLSCAIRCLEAGMKTALISEGQNALHFASGSLDLLGALDGEPVHRPFQVIEKMAETRPNHPYACVGVNRVRDAMNWMAGLLGAEGIEMDGEGESNHLRLGTLGVMRPTWLSQKTVKRLQPHTNLKSVALITIDGFRDFQPALAVAALRKQFGDKLKITTGSIDLDAFKTVKRNPCEFRSSDIAYILQQGDYLAEIAKKLRNQAQGADLVAIPSVLGVKEGIAMQQSLELQSGLKLTEVPTMPPSLPGIRLADALKARFQALGGVLLQGDRVISGEFEQGQLKSVMTRQQGDQRFRADHFVLASGSYFSKGLVGDRQQIREAIFGLDVIAPVARNEWHSEKFFDPMSHPFMDAGVETNQFLNPSLQGEVIDNLYCVGSVLSGYDPVKEGSGSGVAASTGFYAAEQILENWRKKEAV
ncbi:glycerol-3-phosphate dehydrogenase subunit GlpB [Pelagibaculum spongiae]|uniref:Anaerobic glycerol-3-phosphate dehydrogenase subunit B n=1 Tax=Pelagibaculum spongiae TaxID=2080658 RepID=A0A2V1GUG1_9GAMM|nr:glycerol-3-phosphate dehydrogenase subunit GlpB [Pelagibaculum spongiae]PVZ69649.1 anaerobic glycerol-3-phosphate dehydrogenase subunit B [Pelagibaculum spongiae]